MVDMLVELFKCNQGCKFKWHFILGFIMCIHTHFTKEISVYIILHCFNVFCLTFTEQFSFLVQVREKDLSVVISTLEEEFNIYREVEGESVPVCGQDVSNGLQKNGKEGAI